MERFKETKRNKIEKSNEHAEDQLEKGRKVVSEKHQNDAIVERVKALDLGPEHASQLSILQAEIESKARDKVEGEVSREVNLSTNEIKGEKEEILIEKNKEKQAVESIDDMEGDLAMSARIEAIEKLNDSIAEHEQLRIDAEAKAEKLFSDLQKLIDSI